jgi:Na+(H+)/acetate symporter ActP
MNAAVNGDAIVMFLVFVVATLGITYCSARRSKASRGRNITLSAALSPACRTGSPWRATICRRRRFSAYPMVYASGFDGVTYAIGSLIGWPITMFLIAERLRNLGDVISCRLKRAPALFSMPLAFFVTWIVSVTDHSREAEDVAKLFDAQLVRSQTGIGATRPSPH